MPVLDKVAEDDETFQLYPGDIVCAKYEADQEYYLALVELENADGTFWTRWIADGRLPEWPHKRHEIRVVHGPPRQTTVRGQAGLQGTFSSVLTDERLRSLDALGVKGDDGEACKFYAGDVAWARWSDKRWYMAVLTKDNGDGTFELDYFDNDVIEKVISAKFLRPFPFYYVGNCVRFYISRARRASTSPCCLSKTPSEGSTEASGSVSSTSSVVEAADAWEEFSDAPSAAHWLVLEGSEEVEADTETPQELMEVPSAAHWLVLEAAPEEVVAESSTPQEDVMEVPSASDWPDLEASEEEVGVEGSTSQDYTPPSTEVGGVQSEEEEELCMVEGFAEEWQRMRQKFGGCRESETEEEDICRAEELAEEWQRMRQLDLKATESSEELQPCEVSAPPELAAPVTAKPKPPPDFPLTPIAKVGQPMEGPFVPRAKAEPSPEPEPFPEPSIEPVAEVLDHLAPAVAKVESSRDAEVAKAAGTLEPSATAVLAKQGSHGTQSRRGPGGFAKADAKAKRLPDAETQQRRTRSQAASSSTEQTRHSKAQPSSRSSVLDASAEGSLLSGSSAEQHRSKAGETKAERVPDLRVPPMAKPAQQPDRSAAYKPASSRQPQHSQAQGQPVETPRICSEPSGSQPEGSGVQSGSQLEQAARHTGRLLVVPGQEAAAATQGLEEVRTSPQHFTMEETDPPTEEELQHLFARCQHFRFGPSEPTTEEETSQLASSGTTSPLIRGGALEGLQSGTPSVVEEEEPELDEMYDFPPNYGRGSNVWGILRRFQ